MTWLKEPPEQDPEIRKRWMNWRTATMFGSLFVVLPVAITIGLDAINCNCDFGGLVEENKENYWQLFLKFFAFGGLIYFLGTNFLIYILTKRKTDKSDSGDINT